MGDLRAGEAPGRWIAFEGGEACGKSTQASRLAALLDAVLTREPGGTHIGATIRTLLLDTETADMDPRTESLLMAADRAQHLTEVVRPALAAGRHVVSDRSAYSSLAYQGYGRGLDVGVIRAMNDFATQGIRPDLTFLLDLDPQVGLQRAGRGSPGKAPDRIEVEILAFHHRVREGYLTLAREEPFRIVTVDAAQGMVEIGDQVWEQFTASLSRLRGE